MSESAKEMIIRRFGPSDLDVGTAPLDTVHAQLLSHRSRRRYAEQPVEPALLNRLMACALSAPAKSDLQQVSIIDLVDDDQRSKVTSLVPSMPWIKQAPVFLLICGDGRRIKRICDIRGTTFAHDPLDAFLNAAADAAIVMQNFIVAAEAVGLGCCPISGVRDATSEIADLVNLPDDVFPFVGLCVGYPTDDPAISLRLPMSTTVHQDVYDDEELESDIARYDKSRSRANPYSKQRDTDTYGSKENYGWSDDKARQTSHTDRMNFVQYVQEKVLRSA